MSGESVVRRETADGVAVLTIDRPQKLNALNRDVVAALKREIRAAGDDPAVLAVVLTGAGGKAFVAGADIGEMAPLSPDEAAAYAREGQGVAAAIEAAGKPVIAAIEGFALGGGCELALMCHLRVAGPGARFGQPEVALGLIPGFGGTQRLARLVGPGHALDMILTGRQVDAETALAWGLVDRVARDGTALEEARALARSIAAQGPVAVRLCLDAVRRGLDRPLGEALQLEAELFGQAFATGDMREGTRAFLEKRKPAFTGR
jgi:enoyl-CoA hydratase